MRQTQRRICLDVSVMRGAECNTDHQMLRVKLLIKPKKRHKRPRAGNQSRKFDVSKLRGPAIDEKGNLTTMGHFHNVVSQKVKHLWSDEGLEQMWKAVKVALCEAAETVLERESKRQPDWFRESEVSLTSVFEKRNTLYKKWIRTGVESDKIYKRARREARLMTREAEAQKGRNGRKVVWRCIRDIQCGWRGLIPLKTTQVNDENGNICSTPQQQQERWRRHFSKVLNIVSQFDEEELREVRQRPVRSHLAEPPTVKELEEAISKLKMEKQQGSLVSYQKRLELPVMMMTS